LNTANIERGLCERIFWGNGVNAAELLPQVYTELRRLAAVKLAGNENGQTLNATALVHEVWLKLDKAEFETQNPSHFLAVAAMAMRQILVDRARAKLTQKRGERKRVELPDLPAPLEDEQIVALDDVLGRFAKQMPDHANLVELRFFGGLTAAQAAESMGISLSTADRMWKYARAWLDVELSEQ
jgi:RNA polymerase sigma factor (TIGR02999 family)